jgi:hypothetical protein
MWLKRQQKIIHGKLDVVDPLCSPSTRFLRQRDNSPRTRERLSQKQNNPIKVREKEELIKERKDKTCQRNKC